MLYSVDIGNGSHILLTEEKVLVNQYTESSHEYEAFENGMNAVAEAYNVPINTITLAKEHCDVIDEMYIELGVDDPTNDVAKYILNHRD